MGIYSPSPLPPRSHATLPQAPWTAPQAHSAGGPALKKGVSLGAFPQQICVFSCPFFGVVYTFAGAKDAESGKTAYFHTAKVYTEKVYTETGTGKNKDFQTKCASTGVSRRPDIGFILACYRLCPAVGLVGICP